MSPRCVNAVAVLLSVASLAYEFAVPLEIAYHRHALERQWQATFGKPPENYGGFLGYEIDVKSEDYHCRRLAELGYFIHRRYEMENLPEVDGVHSALWRRVITEFPESRYSTLTWPDNVLIVRDLADRESEWDAFVEKYNVADFEERFMSGAEETESP